MSKSGIIGNLDRSLRDMYLSNTSKVLFVYLLRERRGDKERVVIENARIEKDLALAPHTVQICLKQLKDGRYVSYTKAYKDKDGNNVRCIFFE